jgi:tetratricopeptide (TPR) repeat protein
MVQMAKPTVALSQALSRAIAAYSAGKLVKAEKICQEILDTKRDLFDALRLLAIVQSRLGKKDAALASYDRALTVRPDHAETLSNRGVTLHELKRFEGALASYNLALKVRPDSAEVLSNRGRTLHELRLFEEALASYDRALVVRPDLAEALCNRGRTLHELNKFEDALASYARALAVRSDYVEALSNRGNTLHELKRYEEALASYDRALTIRPDYAEVLSNLGNTLRAQGRLGEAEAACRQAIKLKPNLAEAYSNLGLALVNLGRLADGRRALEQAVQLVPRNALYLLNLSDVRHFVAGDSYIVAMEELARNIVSLPVEQQIKLHFALAKTYDDVGRHNESFQQALAGSALKRKQIAYDETATLAGFEGIRQVFTSELIGGWQNVGNPSPVPVFIVGMARSGSTLVEQILASHPQVFGGGELKYFEAAVQGIRTTPGGSTTFPEPVSGMTGEDYRDLGSRYLAGLERLTPGASHITDKMPTNFMFAGLIHLALPNAPIIHTIRDPLDTCLSCFSKLFAEGQNHTYDLAELGRYYRHYQALMAHWHRILPPGRILDVRYEDVVADLEGQARRIIAHCGLNWDPRCLAFHQTERPVLTASAAQVRQPIYNTAIGRWRVHEPVLGPLLAELG